MLDITVGLEKNVWNVDKWCQKLVSCPIMLCFVLRHMPTVGSKIFLKSHLNFHILLNFKFWESHTNAQFILTLKSNFKQNMTIFSSFILRIYEYKLFYGNSIVDVGFFLQQVIRVRPKSIGPKFSHVSVTQIYSAKHYRF